MRWWHRWRGHRIRSVAHVRLWDQGWNLVETLEQGGYKCSCGKLWPI